MVHLDRSVAVWHFLRDFGADVSSQILLLLSEACLSVAGEGESKTWQEEYDNSDEDEQWNGGF